MFLSSRQSNVKFIEYPNEESKDGEIITFILDIAFLKGQILRPPNYTHYLLFLKLWTPSYQIPIYLKSNIRIITENEFAPYKPHFTNQN